MVWFKLLMDMFVTHPLKTRIADTTASIREILAAPPTAEVKTIRYAAGLTETSIKDTRALITDLETRERNIHTGVTRGSLDAARTELTGARRLLGDLTSRLSQQKIDESRALRGVGPQIAERLAPHIGDAITQALEALAAVEMALDPVIEAAAFASRNAVPVPRDTAKAADFAARLLRQARVSLSKVNERVH